MSIVLRRSALVLMITFCLSMTSVAEPPESIESMKLLAPNIGWAATKRHLFWTTDNGKRWKDITPSSGVAPELASVFFLNSSSGWTLLVHRGGATNDVSGFDLARTSDAGRSWAIQPVRIPNSDPALRLPGDARLFFVDGQHGWIDVGGTGGSAFNSGFLIATSDGGASWTDALLPAELEYGGRGSVFFSTPVDGWFTNGMELLVTHDAASHWRMVSLSPPAQVGRASNAAYDLPMVRGGNLFLSVTYSSPYFPKAEAQSAVVLLQSSDAGQTWKVDRILPDREETSSGVAVASALADSTWFVASRARSGRTPAATVSPDGTRSELPGTASSFLQFSFAESLQGWAIDGDLHILATSDGGKTWSEITPTIPHPLSQGARGVGGLRGHPNSRTLSSSDIAQAPTGSATVSVHQGFDETLVAAPGSMDTWWGSSPYYDVAFYLNGGHNRITDKNLIPRGYRACLLTAGA